MRPADRILADINRIASERRALYAAIHGYLATDRQLRQLADYDVATERLYAELRAARCGRQFKQHPRRSLPGRPARPARTCGVDGCQEPARSRGMCLTHYGRFRRYGDPLQRRRERAGRTA
jgi:hypothetical protein